MFSIESWVFDIYPKSLCECLTARWGDRVLHVRRDFPLPTSPERATLSSGHRRIGQQASFQPL